MGTWKLKIFASDMPDDPTNAGADKGEFEFSILRMMPRAINVNDLEHKADGTLDNKILQRGVLDIRLLPFYIDEDTVTASGKFSSSVLDEMGDINNLMLLEKMLRQPYLVIKACELPPWTATNNVTAEYSIPAIVRWNGEISQEVNEELGIIEVTFELEYLYVKGQTQPTPTTDTSTYAY